MREALIGARPVQLEPVNRVNILVPSAYIAGIQKIVLGHRGQIFNLGVKSGWFGMDELTCQIPASEMQNLIVEIRSVTMGVGTFEAKFDHLQELSNA